MMSIKDAKFPLFVHWTISVTFVAQKPQKWPRMAIFGAFSMISQSQLEFANSKHHVAPNHLLGQCQNTGFCSGVTFSDF